MSPSDLQLSYLMAKIAIKEECGIPLYYKNILICFMMRP